MGTCFLQDFKTKAKEISHFHSCVAVDERVFRTRQGSQLPAFMFSVMGTRQVKAFAKKKRTKNKKTQEQHRWQR